MRFVRPARCYSDMNLMISQQNGSIYYTTTRAILPKQELQVGYGAAYAAKRQLPILEPQPGIGKLIYTIEKLKNLYAYNNMGKI